MGDTDQQNQLQSKYAHFEYMQPSLLGLYYRHAEGARDIHQNSLRKFTGNDALTVDLVRESPLHPKVPETIEKLQKYDAVSVSTEVAPLVAIKPFGIATVDVVDLYKKVFSEEDMPVYVVAAGNRGDTEQRAKVRVADFARNSLVVGEAYQGDGELYIEEHSSRINPTLASDSPFNHGVKHQLFNPNPSLEGHEDLMREWLIDKEVNDQFAVFRATDEGQKLAEGSRALADKYYEILGGIHSKYEEDEEAKADLTSRIAGYVKNPESFHRLVFSEIRKEVGVDENGYVTDVDGTSFSGPEQAGYISGALYEQEQRENKDLPILTKDEITTLAKMATVDTRVREGDPEPMYVHTNDDKNTFVTGGGHGVFQPEMFRKLLDESYRRIETNPDINRDSVTTVVQAKLDENHNGAKAVNVKLDLLEGTHLVIDRMRADIEFEVNGSLPHHIQIDRTGSEDHEYTLQMAQGNDTKYRVAWSRIENSFGEEASASDSWKLQLMNGHDTTVQDMSVTVYGYHKGGLMDQMMDYSKEQIQKIENQITPEVAPDTLLQQQANDTKAAIFSPISPSEVKMR